jgi:hypothetical protein
VGHASSKREDESVGGWAMLLMHDADLKVGVYKLSNWTEKWEKLHESGRESEGTAFQTDKEKGHLASTHRYIFFTRNKCLCFNITF